MASRQDYEENRKLEKLEHALREPLIYVNLRHKLCERTEDGEDWHVVREVDDVHLLINRITGDRIRILAEELSDLDEELRAEFFALAETAERHIVEWTLHEKQLAMVRDVDHRVIFASGGQRAGKTRVMAMWCARQWFLKGGPAVTALWVSPELEMTTFAVEYLVTGQDDLEPLLPRALIAYYPPDYHVKKNYIRFVDGTKLQLKHASETRRGGNLKGRGPRWICVDEACEIRARATWRVIRGRLNKRGGEINQCFLASTPMPGHWAHEEIVMLVDAGVRPTFTYVHADMRDNVFIPLSEVFAAIEEAGGEDDPICQREVFGMWVSSGPLLWYHFNSKRNIKEFQTLDELGLVDVTRFAVDMVFGEKASCRRDLMGGQDFNLDPCTTVIFKWGVPKDPDGRPPRDAKDPAKWVIVVVDEFVTRNQGTEMHGHLLAAKYPNLGISCDPDGAQFKGKREPGTYESKSESMDLEAAGHTVKAAHFSADGFAYHLPQIDSITVGNKLLRGDGKTPRAYVHSRCKELSKSLLTQQATPRGTKNVQPHAASDRLASASDAWRYGYWPVERGMARQRRPKKRPRRPSPYD